MSQPLANDTPVGQCPEAVTGARTASPPRPGSRPGRCQLPRLRHGGAARAIGVTPAFLRAAEAAGLFEIARSDGGHRRYSREDLRRADRARHLVDDGIRMDAAARIVSLEYQLAAAHAMIELLRGKTDPPKNGAARSDPAWRCLNLDHSRVHLTLTCDGSAAPFVR